MQKYIKIIKPYSFWCKGNFSFYCDDRFNANIKEDGNAFVNVFNQIVHIPKDIFEVIE